MKKKVAFITGIGGMDGANLSEYLFSLDYEVHGLIRRHSVSESQESRISYLGNKVKTYYGDMLDVSVLEKLLREIQPDEIYHLAAMSHVQVSFQTPSFTLQTNGLGTLNILEAYRNNCPKAHFYMAASSECFGLTVDEDGFQKETTVMNPTSPYGCSKVLCYNLVRHYRRAYNLFCSNGILFNHTGEKRGSAFVEAKIVKQAVMIKLGLLKTMELGNLKASRDIGASKDYVKAMYLIVNHEKADDFVISTGVTHTIEDICRYVFSKLDLNWENHVVINDKYLRQEELPFLKGDSSKARSILGWKPTYTFEAIMDEMISYQFNLQ
jgi:GDPmannose 4,6-dehydratase